MTLLDELLAKLEKADPDAIAEIAKKAEAAKKATGLIVSPNPGPQTMAYYSPADTLYYGGQPGGGKSVLLLILAMNEHSVSRLFRRQFKDIDGEGGLVPTATSLIGSSKGYRSDKHIWTIPKELTAGKRRAIEFAAFETPKEAEAYQGRAADFFGFDEAVQFQEDILRFIIAWNRTAIPGQRCRTVLASNPPLTPEGLWIFDWFAPWLDPEHPNPAVPGELRWFAQVEGHEIEVDADYEAVIYDASGNELIVKPKSRTFVPASLVDNPDLLESGYASQLAGLPKHLQDALASGRFSTTLADADRQIIPTAWVLAAQERFMLKKKDLIEHRMDALGVDVASGGKDRLVCVPLHGVCFGPARSKPGDEVRTAGEKFAFVMECAKDDPQFNVDNNGYGDDLCSALESNNFNVNRLKGSHGATALAKDGREYENYRAQMIFEFKDALDPEFGDNIALPPGRDLVMELTSFREKPREDMRKVIRVESNDEIKQRIGRSPDLAWGHFFAWCKPSALAREERASYVRKRAKRQMSSSPQVHRQYGRPAGRR